MTLPMPASPASARASGAPIVRRTSAPRAAASPALVRCMRGLPAARLLACRIVEVHDDLPDLVFGEAVLPGRHDGIPGCGFLREAGSAFGDAPEEVGLLEHRDGAGIDEVRGRRVEAVREVALPVQVVAVAVHAVADV